MDWNIFYFHLYLGMISILTNIFQLGWNHQLDYNLARILWKGLSWKKSSPGIPAIELMVPDAHLVRVNGAMKKSHGCSGYIPSIFHCYVSLLEGRGFILPSFVGIIINHYIRMTPGWLLNNQYNGKYPVVFFSWLIFFQTNSCAKRGGRK